MFFRYLLGLQDGSTSAICSLKGPSKEYKNSQRQQISNMDENTKEKLQSISNCLVCKQGGRFTAANCTMDPMYTLPPENPRITPMIHSN
ncbi:hypothetical protein MKW92_026521, partial [Papaver armeniacum]